MQSTSALPVIGMGIAKSVFQRHVVDAQTGEVTRHKLRRDRVNTFFANRQRSLVTLEVCDDAHHWARTLQALGHEVKLLPARHVHRFVLRDKTDARDAQAIPGIGPLAATALVATATDLSSFDSGRLFAAWHRRQDPAIGDLQTR